MLTSEYLQTQFTKHSLVQRIQHEITNLDKKRIAISNVSGSATNIIFSNIFNHNNNTLLLLYSDKELAAYAYNDLVKLSGDENVFFYPSSHKHSVSRSTQLKIDHAGLILRTEVLNAINSDTKKKIIVTYPESLLEKVITNTSLKKNTLLIKCGEKLDVDFLTEVLIEYNFERVDFVYEPGQYSVRGSIVDIFSFANDHPFRIDFFGDEIESIRTFDIISQLSKAKFDTVSIIPNLQTQLIEEKRISFFEFIPSDSLVFISDLKYIIERIDLIYNNTINSAIAETAAHTIAAHQLESGKEIFQKIQNFKIIEFSNNPFFKESLKIQFNTSPQPLFQKNFGLLTETLQKYAEENYQNIILSENEKQIERLKEIFISENAKHEINFTPLLTVFHEGFIDHDLKICCFTDHQIFDRYHRFNLKDSSQSASKEALTIKELNNLNPGDYVVHVDHGIGVFGGLDQISVNGKKQEVIRLVYQDKDILYVSIHSLHRISKYKGKDGEPPKIYKLGSGAWQKLKQKTKSRVKDIAKELIALYAKRRNENGFQFSKDTYLQQELEASFIYEDTPDQLKATEAVKSDMEAPVPMDRLVCGDVGFGKTEVAIRAAFKAVTDSKQVAVLVPTTILAMQHFKTFSDRLKNFPCNVDYINRFKSTKEQKETLKNLQEGKIDILIGTHRIVSKDISFKDLGLLIIDEEQKFGVSIKEKLKNLKLNVDTLTLTATPIPRTLQFSLMGARDLSVINTPPPNRYPIITELHAFNEDIIKDAIEYEIQRNGQVFFIHNRVQNINEVEALIKRICPNVKTGIVHGQMDGEKLEKTMLGFINEDFEVLIATAIIESGLDISNANTIIINDAHHFGLSDLHQLRGRVGRSNKKAFCYLLAPPPSVLTQEARRRLKAIETFAELGSGLNIALQDLDIRGAGNLLGGEQSGFIADIGFETYQRILDEALLELRETEYKEIEEDNQDTNNQTSTKPKPITADIKFVNDCVIDTDLSILIPEYYIENITERVRLYRELDNIQNINKLTDFVTGLTDRFGTIPEETKELIDIVKLRWLAIDLGFEKIILKNKKMICYFVSNQDSAYYQTQIFNSILMYMQKNPKICQLKESSNKLYATFDQVKTVRQSIEILTKIIK